jgi:queuine tRNA-ribosyltransferase
MPDGKPKYAMGVGKPQDIKECVGYGYNMFDCVLPTRDARHERLYVFSGKSYKYLYIGSGKFKKDNKPVSKVCKCETCKNYSRAYLYNLFKNRDPLAIRLATIHNLRFYTDLMKLFD